MKVLTMTKIMSDVDTVALIGYNESPDKAEYVREHCREHYGTAAPVIAGAVAKAFRDTSRVFTEPSGNRRAIQMEELY